MSSFPHAACPFSSLSVCSSAASKASDSGKATLSLDHVLDALKDAGFEDMVSAVALQVNGTNCKAATTTLHVAITHARIASEQYV